MVQKDGIPARIKKKIFRTKTGASVSVEFWENYTKGDEIPISGKTGDLDPKIEVFLGFDDQILLNSWAVIDSSAHPVSIY